MTNKVVTTRTDDGAVAWVTFERDHRLNPIDHEMLELLLAAVSQVQADPKVRVLVLRGGREHFSAGADVTHMRSVTPAGRAAFMDTQNALLDAVEASRPVTIACLSGYCYGNGMELSLCCDLRVAADDTRLCLPEIRAGFSGPAIRLSRYVGVGVAARLLLLGQELTAEEALKLDLVTAVASQEDLHAAVSSMATELANLRWEGVTETRRRLHQHYGMLPLR